MDIQALRKMRTTNFAKITQEMERVANPYNNGPDENIWKLERDKSGNASAVIRFLPATEGDDLPWVKIYTHGFQGPTGKWYIENSLTTFNEEDPVSIVNGKLWNSGNESDKEIARKQKRRLSFTSNILVVSDPNHPENDGKVFLFKYGKKIFDMIMDKASPTFVDEEAVNIFHLWEGCNFNCRIKTVEGYPNYDKSTFANPSELYNGDEAKILDVVNSQHKLSELVDRKNFKTFAELQKKFNNVMNIEDELPFAPTPQAKAVTPAPKLEIADDDDDILDYFNKIAAGE